MSREFELRVGGYPRGVMWLRFYTNIRFPLSFLFSGLTLFMFLEPPPGLYSNDFIGVSIFFGICMLAFRIVVFISMRNLEAEAYGQNMGLLVAETLELAILNSTSIRGTPWYWFFFSLAVLTLSWWLPNFIYFKKRKAIFQGQYSLSSLSQLCYAPPKNAPPSYGYPLETFTKAPSAAPIPERNVAAGIAVQYCRKCCTALPADSVFCHRCGTKIER